MNTYDSVWKLFAKQEAFRRLPGIEQARRFDEHDPIAVFTFGRTRPTGYDDLINCRKCGGRFLRMSRTRCACNEPVAVIDIIGRL